MNRAFQTFRDSGVFVVIATLFPVVAVVVAVLLYLNADALRDQAAEHRAELLNAQGRVAEKDAQIILLNEQIKQKTTQVGILRSRVELLEKLTAHQEALAQIPLQAATKELEKAEELNRELGAKLAAFETLGSKFGQADKISETLGLLQRQKDDALSRVEELERKLRVYEPNRPSLATAKIPEGAATQFLNQRLTVGVIDAYGSWGYINVSSLGQQLLEREEIRPGRNVPLVVEQISYVLVVEKISDDMVTFRLLSGEK